MRSPSVVRSRRDVVVVGAGLAGLAAAWRLAAAGHTVQLLERAPRAGGRATVAEHAGRAVDPTAARVGTGDRALLGLLREAGLERELLPLRPWVSAQASGGAPRPIEESGLLAIARIPGVRLLEALRLVRLPRLLRRYAKHLDPERPEQAAPLDDRSLRDFAALYFGRSVVDHWIEPWLAERAPLDERETSRAVWLLRWVADRGAAGGALREPVGLLAELLAARLGVRVSCAVRRVAAGDGGLRVEFEGTRGPGELRADAVVLAVPAPEASCVAAPLLSAPERDFLAAVRYDPALAWVCDARPLAVSAPTRLRVPRCTGSPLSLVALEPGGSGRAGEVGAGRVTAIARAPWSRGAQGAADDAVAKELAAAVAHEVPGGIAAQSTGLVRRWPQGWPRFEVGHYRALARFRAVQEDLRRGGRRLYFAGDFLFAPTLEGAVASGLRAADDAIADL